MIFCFQIPCPNFMWRCVSQSILSQASFCQQWGGILLRRSAGVAAFQASSFWKNAVNKKFCLHEFVSKSEQEKGRLLKAKTRTKVPPPIDQMIVPPPFLCCCEKSKGQLSKEGFRRGMPEFDAGGLREIPRLSFLCPGAVPGEVRFRGRICVQGERSVAPSRLASAYCLDRPPLERSMDLCDPIPQIGLDASHVP